MTSKGHHTFDVMLDGILMSARCTFDVEPRVCGVDLIVDIGVAISVDGGVEMSVDIGVPIGVVVRADICAPIAVDSWTSKHIKSFDGGLMLGL